MPSDEPRASRLAIGITSGAALLGCAVLAAISALMSWFGTCGGDGGYPFSARASTAGQLCYSAAGDVYTIGQLGLPILVVLVLGAYAVVRAEWSFLAIGVGLAVTVVVVMLVVMASLPQHCSEEQRRTLDPYDCETY